MNQPDLLPCPFCGSTHVHLGIYATDASLSGAQSRRNPAGIKGSKVECLTCQATITTPGTEPSSREIVKEKWNRRLSPEERAAITRPADADEPLRQAEILARREGLRNQNRR